MEESTLATRLLEQLEIMSAEIERLTKENRQLKNDNQRLLAQNFKHRNMDFKINKNTPH
jgi:hypothetical protein